MIICAGSSRSCGQSDMRALLSLVFLSLLAGCGYKGPLYLPKPKPEPQAAPAPPAQDTKKAKEAP